MFIRLLHLHLHVHKTHPPDLLLQFHEVHVCASQCVRVCTPVSGEKKPSVYVLIYDALLVINMVLLSHLDAVIDTWSGQHMGWELEL